MAITEKQRILAAVHKQAVDKLPFGARIDVWYNYHAGHDTLPEKYREWNIPDILRDQGAGIELRHGYLWKVEYRDTEVVVYKDPPFTTTEYRTTKGTVSMKTMFTPQEGPGEHRASSLLGRLSQKGRDGRGRRYGDLLSAGIFTDAGDYA